jgi:hypothetical protein
MSFAADLKEFVSNFRDTYKTFKPIVAGAALCGLSVKDAKDNEVGDQGAANASLSPLSRRAVDTGDTPSSGYNPKGKLPAFAEH